MTTSERDGWIEIELTETDRRERARRQHEAARPEPRTDPRDGPDTPADRGPSPGPGRRRTIAVAAVAGLAGVLAGWLVGNDGNPPEAGPDTAPTATSARSTLLDDPALVEPAAPELTAPRTTERVTTTTQVERVVETLGLDPRLVGLPYEIVSISPSGELTYIDLANDRLRVNRSERMHDTGRLLAGPGWVLAPAHSGGRALLFEDGATAPRTVDGFGDHSWLIGHRFDDDHVWVAGDGLGMGLAGPMIEMTPDGEPTGVTVELPAEPVLLAADGAWIVNATGGVYSIGPDGTRRISTGELIAFGAAAAVVRECDEQLECGLAVVSPATGERRALDLALDGRETLDAVNWWWSPGETVSPDGSYALLTLTSYQPGIGGEYAFVPQLVLVDLATGERTRVTVSSFVDPAAFWSADSRFVFFRTDMSVMAYDTVAGESIKVAATGHISSRFAVRSSEREDPAEPATETP